jgi:hypothetical protein
LITQVDLSKSLVLLAMISIGLVNWLVVRGKST